MDKDTIFKMIKKAFIYHGLKRDKPYKIFYVYDVNDNPTMEDAPFILVDYSEKKAVYDIQILTDKYLYNTKIDGISKDINGNKVNVY
jgi:hypothetical protein